MLNITELIGFGSGGSTGWEYVSTGADGTGSAPTVPLPSGIVSGDLLIIHAGGDATTITAPAGWNTVLSSTAGARHLVCWKIAGASESAPACGGGHSTSVAVMHAYRNILSSPVDVAGTDTSASSTTATASAVTTTTSGTLLISFFACRQQNTLTWTPPSGTGINLRYQKDPVNTVNIGLVLVDENRDVSGLTTTRTASLTVSQANSGIQVAFKRA